MRTIPLKTAEPAIFEVKRVEDFTGPDKTAGVEESFPLPDIGEEIFNAGRYLGPLVPGAANMAAQEPGKPGGVDVPDGTPHPPLPPYDPLPDPILRDPVQPGDPGPGRPGSGPDFDCSGIVIPKKAFFIDRWKYLYPWGGPIDDPDEPDEPDLSVPELRTQTIRLTSGNTYSWRFMPEVDEYISTRVTFIWGGEGSADVIAKPQNIVVWLSKTPNSRSDILQYHNRNAPAQSGPTTGRLNGPIIYATTDQNYTPDFFAEPHIVENGYVIFEPGITYYLNAQILSSGRSGDYSVAFSRREGGWGRGRN